MCNWFALCAHKVACKTEFPLETSREFSCVAITDTDKRLRCACVELTNNSLTSDQVTELSSSVPRSNCAVSALSRVYNLPGLKLSCAS